MPPTELLFRAEPYARTCEARISAVEPGSVRLDRTIFYPEGGGQPGDTGVLRADDGTVLAVQDTRKGEGADDVLHMIDPGSARPAPGSPRRCRARLGSAVTATCACTRACIC